MLKYIIRLLNKLIQIILGYIPVGISFAIIATNMGLSNLEIISMSLFVLGAASQIAAVPLIDSGEGIFYIFIVTFLINLRHVALASSLAPHLKHFSSMETALFSYGLSDESYTIHIFDIESGTFEKTLAISINVGTHIIWVLSTIIGCLIGMIITNYMSSIRIDFALMAMFVCIISMYIKINVYEEQVLLVSKLLRFGFIGLFSILCSIILYHLSFKGPATFLPAVLVGAYVLLIENRQKNNDLKSTIDGL